MKEILVSANCGNNSISVRKLNNDSKEYPVGQGPKDVVIDSIHKKIFTSNSISNTISEIDLLKCSLRHSDPFFSDPRGLTLSPDGKHLYIVNKDAAKVVKLSTENLRPEQEFFVGKGPRNVKIDRTGTILFVTNNEDSTLSVITPSGQWALPVYPKPYGLCVANNQVFVTSIEHHCLTCLDLGSSAIKRQIMVGRHPTSVTPNSDCSLLYVTNLDDDSVSVVDLACFAKIREIPVGKLPYASAISQDGSLLFVTNNGSDSISVMDVKSFKVIETIPVSQDPHGIAYGII